MSGDWSPAGTEPGSLHFMATALTHQGPLDTIYYPDYISDTKIKAVKSSSVCSNVIIFLLRKTGRCGWKRHKILVSGPWVKKFCQFTLSNVTNLNVKYSNVLFLYTYGMHTPQANAWTKHSLPLDLYQTYTLCLSLRMFPRSSIICLSLVILVHFQWEQLFKMPFQTAFRQRKINLHFY